MSNEKPAAPAPSGWKLVPAEPTMGMYDDWNAARKNGPSDGVFGTWIAAYQAMLAAAPAAPAPCIGNDPACPCQDGDLCHYKDSPDGTRAWAAPAEPQQPVAWRRWHEETGGEYGFTDDLNIVANYPGEYEPLYASPPRAAVLADRAARAAAQAEPVAWVAGNQSGSSGYWIELRYVHGDAAKFKIGDWIYASPPRAAAPVEDAVHFTAHNTVAAPAEPQQPVAWMWQNGKDWMVTKDPSYCPRKGYRRTPLFASPLRDSAWVAEAMRLADEYADEAALYQRRLDDPQSDPEMDLQQKDDTDAARSALEAWLKS